MPKPAPPEATGPAFSVSAAPFSSRVPWTETNKEDDGTINTSRKVSIDGTHINANALPARINRGSPGLHDAARGVHAHHTQGSDGVMRETVKRWFGFKLHLITGTNYELPIAFIVLPANHNEMPVMYRLVDHSACRSAQECR